ncbi:MAG TPA: HD domain-containing phosphohydrolase [Pirellulales bacterium]|nr:HD domain-containing phosphohydrolase [Pirellulales bacterium]
MIVDDEPINVKIVRKYLNLEGYHNLVSTCEPRDAIDLITREEPDAVLLDIMMPRVSGLDILRTLRADSRWLHLPVVILTAASDLDTKRTALELGANDFLGKPLDPTELIPRIRNAVTVKQHFDCLRSYSQELEAEVLRRTAALARSRQEVIHCLARAAEFRDDNTGRHVWRVGRYARLIAAELGWQGERLEMLEQAAQLHDIGKIGIPDSILLKPGKLTVEEYNIMKKHSGYGQRISVSLPENRENQLSDHTTFGSRLLETTESPILALAGIVALSHHEKWDGSGYPMGLAGEAIPIEGRITAVADVFDALSSKRPYKPAFELEKCFEIIVQGRSTHFDPEVVDAFLRVSDQVIRTQIEYADDE